MIAAVLGLIVFSILLLSPGALISFLRVFTCFLNMPKITPPPYPPINYTTHIIDGQKAKLPSQNNSHNKKKPFHPLLTFLTFLIPCYLLSRARTHTFCSFLTRFFCCFVVFFGKNLVRLFVCCSKLSVFVFSLALFFFLPIP